MLISDNQSSLFQSCKDNVFDNVLCAQNMLMMARPVYTAQQGSFLSNKQQVMGHVQKYDLGASHSLVTQTHFIDKYHSFAQEQKVGSEVFNTRMNQYAEELTQNDQLYRDYLAVWDGEDDEIPSIADLKTSDKQGNLEILEGLNQKVLSLDSILDADRIPDASHIITDVRNRFGSEFPLVTADIFIGKYLETRKDFSSGGEEFNRAMNAVIDSFGRGNDDIYRHYAQQNIDGILAAHQQHNNDLSQINDGRTESPLPQLNPMEMLKFVDKMGNMVILNYLNERATMFTG